MFSHNHGRFKDVFTFWHLTLIEVGPSWPNSLVPKCFFVRWPRENIWQQRGYWACEKGPCGNRTCIQCGSHLGMCYCGTMYVTMYTKSWLYNHVYAIICIEIGYTHSVLYSHYVMDDYTLYVAPFPKVTTSILRQSAPALLENPPCIGWFSQWQKPPFIEDVSTCSHVFPIKTI